MNWTIALALVPWRWTIALLVVAIALMVAAPQVKSAEGPLWIAGSLVAFLGICAAYGVVIGWARRRKRLWG